MFKEVSREELEKLYPSKPSKAKPHINVIAPYGVVVESAEHYKELTGKDWKSGGGVRFEYGSPLGVCDGERAMEHERDACEPGRLCENWRPCE